MATISRFLTISKEIGGLCTKFMSLELKKPKNTSQILSNTWNRRLLYTTQWTLKNDSTTNVTEVTKAEVVAPTTETTTKTDATVTTKTTTDSSEHDNLTTAPVGLMDFFDIKKNWGESEVKSGRAWLPDELRIKSNSDIHKLWFVLLKERNMLLTMEQECNDNIELFPSPERLDKVKLSMENIELIVRERNRAYYELETGIDGERPGRLVDNQLGMKFFYRETEHLIPKEFNGKWRERHVFGFRGMAVKKFRKLYKEQLYSVKRKANNRNRNEVMHLLRRNPNLSKEFLAKQYPKVDIKKLINTDKIRGHFVPKL